MQSVISLPTLLLRLGVVTRGVFFPPGRRGFVSTLGVDDPFTERGVGVGADISLAHSIIIFVSRKETRYAVQVFITNMTDINPSRFPANVAP